MFTAPIAVGIGELTSLSRFKVFATNSRNGPTLTKPSKLLVKILKTLPTVSVRFIRAEGDLIFSSQNETSSSPINSHVTKSVWLVGAGGDNWLSPMAVV